MLQVLFFLAVILHRSSALSWPSSLNSPAIHFVGHINHFPKLGGLTQEEVDTLSLNHDSLLDYTRKPDCFRRAASALRMRCAEADMREDERINAAIVMTLCELSTASHHSIPLECTPFSLDKIDQVSLEFLSQGDCVEAFSRSTQFWSSYSGYLREVPQLCFAFRRWNDIDLAKDIYRNITIEKISLLEFLSKREKNAAENMQIFSSRLQDLQSLVGQLRSASEMLDGVTVQVSSRIQAHVTDTMENFEKTSVDLLHAQSQAAVKSAAQTKLELDNISSRHEHHLQELVSFVRDSVARDLSLTFEQHYFQQEALRDLTNRIHVHWSEITTDFTDFQQAFTGLSNVTHTLTASLSRASDDAESARETQNKLIISVSELTSSLAQLTLTTHAELDKINGSAHLIQETLVLKDQNNGLWMKNRIIMILEVFLRVDPHLANYIINLPSFRIFMLLFSCASSFVRVSFSAVMSLCFVFFLLSKKLAKHLVDLSMPSPSLTSSPEIGILQSSNSCQRVSHPTSLIFSRGTQWDTRLSHRSQELRRSRIPRRLWQPQPN